LEKFQFSVEKFEVQEDPASHFTKLKLYIVSEGNNLHNLPIAWETIEDAKLTLVGKPVLCKYNPYTQAFEGHEDDEIPVGFFFKDEEVAEEIIDGKRWLTSIAYIWKKYFPEVVEVFRKNDGQSPISMEIEVYQLNEHEDQLQWIEKFAFTGVTLIGVPPAIENAKGEVLQFSQLVAAAQQEFSSKYADLDFKIPEAVKQSAQMGLDLHAQSGLGTSSGLAHARFLVKNAEISVQKTQAMAKYLGRHAADEMVFDPPNGSYVAWNLWGGHAGYRWSNALVREIERIDEECKNLSYFTGAQQDKTSQKEVKNGMEFKTEIEKKFSLTYAQITEIINNALSEYRYSYGEGYECRKYYGQDFDDTYVYVWDYEDEKLYRMTYTIADNAATVNVEGREEVIRGKYEVVGQGQTFADEDRSKQEGEPVDDKEGDDSDSSDVSMSLNAYLDIPAALAWLEAETEDAEEMASRQAFAEELKKDAQDYGKLVAQAFGLYQRMCKKYAESVEACKKMAAEKEAFAQENGDLKVFKADIEKQRKNFEVDKVLNEIQAFVPKEFIDEARADAEKYAFCEISAWGNVWKSKALPHVVRSIPKESDGIVRMQMPYVPDDKNAKKSIWD
jgi:hypothetical protein